MPVKFQTVFDYDKYENFSGASATAQVFAVVFNDMSSPVGAAGDTDQPMLYDELMGIYSRNYVYACSIKVTISNNDDVSGINMTFYPSNDLSDISGAYQRMKGQPESTSMMMSPENGGSNVRSMRKFFYVKKYADEQSLDNLSATVNSSPATKVYWVANIQNLEGNATYDISVKYELRFYTKLFGLNLLAQS